MGQYPDCCPTFTIAVLADFGEALTRSSIDFVALLGTLGAAAVAPRLVLALGLWLADFAVRTDEVACVRVTASTLRRTERRE